MEDENDFFAIQEKKLLEAQCIKKKASFNKAGQDKLGEISMVSERWGDLPGRLSVLGGPQTIGLTFGLILNVLMSLILPRWYGYLTSFFLLITTVKLVTAHREWISLWGSLTNDVPLKIFIAFWTEVCLMHWAKSTSEMCEESSAAHKDASALAAPGLLGWCNSPVTRTASH